MKYAVILIATLLVFSCDDAETLTPADTPSIKYGTSFGECVGHCVIDMEVTAESAYLITYGWNNSVTPITKSTSFQEEQYQTLLDMIDGTKFLALDPVIGCPDCADGGAEWIEMTLGTRTKKVTFEYGASIDGINDVIVELRKLRLQLLPNE
jgi:hypothetical protein